MQTHTRMLSVIDISKICGVARSTASYWITQKGLSALRTGNKFMVAIEDLVIFLESIGRPVPQTLVESLGGAFAHPFKQHQTCWNYWEKDPHGKNCRDCAVYKYSISECFTSRNNGAKCAVDCAKCQYFYEHYTQYISFIHQISMPVAIFKDMYIWSGNRAWANLCGVELDRLLGMGVEEIIHPESIRIIIDFNRKMQQGDNAGIFKLPIRFENQNRKKVMADISITPLKQPKGACFAIAENVLD